MKKLFISMTASLLISGSMFASGDVLATVNGKKITKDDAVAILKVMPGANYDQLPKETQEKVLEQLIERVLLIENAKKGGIEKSKEYKDTLEKIKDDLALEVWMKSEYEKIKISEKQAKDYYEANKDKFKQPETVKARHILVKSEDEAKAIIEKLKKVDNAKLIEEFKKIAETNSTGPSAKNGGDLGWFNKKQMVPEFSNAAFGLKKGEFTKSAVKTQFGYHVILVEDKKAEGVTEFAKVKENIENILKMEKFKEDISKKAKALKDKAKIEISK